MKKSTPSAPQGAIPVSATDKKAAAALRKARQTQRDAEKGLTQLSIKKVTLQQKEAIKEFVRNLQKTA